MNKKIIVALALITLSVGVVFADIRDSLEDGWNVNIRGNVTQDDIDSSRLDSVWAIEESTEGVKTWCVIKGASNAVSTCDSSLSDEAKVWIDKD